MLTMPTKISLALLLGLNIGFAYGRSSDCVVFRQDGPSVLDRETRLLLNITDTSENFRIYVRHNGEKLFVFERRRGVKTFLRPCLPKYSCDLRETDMTFRVTILKTTFDEAGRWDFTYHGDTACVDYSTLHIKVLDLEKASTRVNAVTSGNPIEGQEYSMHCEITGGTPMADNAYEWKRDGVKETETGATLTIKEVERSMHGANYTCAADNGAGMGEHSEAVTLKVWSKPTVYVSVASHSIKEGSTETMGCLMSDTYPDEVKGVQWMKNGSFLSRPGVEGGTVDNPNITLNNVTLDDSGDYVCVLTNNVGDRYSEAVHVEVIAQYKHGVASVPTTGKWRVPIAIVCAVVLIVALAGLAIFLIKRKRAAEHGSGTRAKSIEDASPGPETPLNAENPHAEDDERRGSVET